MTGGIVDEAEVVVVGGGPSGSSAAARLRELGHDVLLIDQTGFPRDKPCGDGLTHSAVATLERRGFGDLLANSQPIEDVRVVLGHDREIAGWYRPWPHPPDHARTIPRRNLDLALFERATDSGARFLEARVDGPLFEGDRLRGVALAGDAGEVRARCVIAADGATSRLRREAGLPRSPLGSHVYALRCYATVQAPLDPLFDVYVPLLYEGGLLAGYGWVFPVAPRRANVGVAYYEPPPGRPRARIREVLASFIGSLESQSTHRFGRLTDRSEPIGAPIATQFSPELSQRGPLIFTGEAARAADPLSGEGISFALTSGDQAADEAHALLSGPRGPGQGRRIAQTYTRLGQDLSLPARLAAAAATGLTLFDRAYLPYVHRVQRVTSFAPDEPVLSATDVHRSLAAADPTTGTALDRVNEHLLETLWTDFPFALELSHREIRTGGGPVAAALAIAIARALSDEVDERHVRAATALATLSLVRTPYGDVADEISSEAGRANNMLACLTGGFLVSRAVAQAVRVGGRFATDLPGVAAQIIECMAAEREDVGNVTRSAERHRETSGRSEDLLGKLAVVAGVAGSVRNEATAGLEIGAGDLLRAWRICNEVRDLTIGDEVAGRPPGDDVRARRMTLPLILAAEADPAIAEGLTSKLDAAGNRELLARLRKSGALDGAAEICASLVQRWQRAVEDAGLSDAPALTALGPLCLERLTVDQPRTPSPVPGANLP
jgi:geranylgeranyl reductase family protein